MKTHRVYYEILRSENNLPQLEQTKNTFSNEISIKEYMLSDNDISLNVLKHNNSTKYGIILDIMNEFIFDGKNDLMVIIGTIHIL